MRRFLTSATLALAGLLSGLAAGPAAAKIYLYGPFRFDDSLPTVLTLEGEIGGEIVYDFRKALREHPGVTALFLNSPGGSVYGGLELSAVIHDRGLATVIPPEAMCASACSFLFVAGVQRAAYGVLGVHQFASGDGGVSEGDAQHVTAEIIDFLREYDIPLIFMVRMLETPNTDMYWFDAEELEKEKLVTGVTFEAEVAQWAQLPASDGQGGMAAAEPAAPGPAPAPQPGANPFAPGSAGPAPQAPGGGGFNPFAPAGQPAQQPSSAPQPSAPQPSAPQPAAPASGGGYNPFAPGGAAPSAPSGGGSNPFAPVDPANPFQTRGAAAAPARPSFDCAVAGSDTERAICTSGPLAERDLRLAARFEALVAGQGGATLMRLRISQSAWLARRDECGSDTGCIAAAYDARLAELGG